MRKEKTVQLTTLEAIILFQELNHLMGKEIKIGARFYLNKIYRLVAEIVEDYKELEKGLVENHGEGTDEFRTEQKEAFQYKNELKYPTIYLSDIDDIVSDKPYNILFSLI